MEEDVINKMRLSSTISLMADESTTVSVTKELIVYGRCVKEITFSQNAQT